MSENKGKFLLWLQQVLVECCFIKLNVVCDDEKSVNEQASKHIMEPVPYHYICKFLQSFLNEINFNNYFPSTVKQQSIPLVPFNTEQSKILVYQPFLLLLHKLGFHLPADANKLFVRIPEFWSAEVLFSVAERLGPISKRELQIIKVNENILINFFLTENLKFDMSRLRRVNILKVLAVSTEIEVKQDGNLTRFVEFLLRSLLTMIESTCTLLTLAIFPLIL